MKIDLLAYRPPRIAMLLLAVAATANLALPVDAIGPASLRSWGPAVGISGFCVMMQAWWQFKRTDVAICPTAETSALITDGIYRFTRNPMYLGMVMMLAGIALIVGTLPFYVAAVTLFAILNFVFCPYEEAKLERTFGSPFRQYRIRVRRWL